MSNHRLDKQPKWVLEHIGKLERRIQEIERELERCRNVHALTCDGRDWFTLGQANEYVSTLATPCSLYVPVGGDIVRVASLGRGDCLLVARAKKAEVQHG